MTSQESLRALRCAATPHLRARHTARVSKSRLDAGAEAGRCLAQTNRLLLSSLLLTRLIRPTFAASSFIAVAIDLLLSGRALAVRRVAAGAVAWTLPAFTLMAQPSAGAMLLIAPTLVVLIVRHAPLLDGIVATAQTSASARPEPMSSARRTAFVQSRMRAQRWSRVTAGALRGALQAAREAVT